MQKVKLDSRMPSGTDGRKFKTIFSMRIWLDLKKRGIHPILEKDNLNKEGFKCWIYDLTPELERALDEIMGVQHDDR